MVLQRCYCVFPTDSHIHYNVVMMSAMASQINALVIVYSTVYSRRRWNKTSKLRVTGFCERNSAVTGEFPAQRANNAENVSIWWRHYILPPLNYHIVPQLRCGLLRGNTGLHNEAWIKWKELCRRHFEIRFPLRTVVLWSKFEVYYEGFIW